MGKRNSYKYGFTLIELLIVVAIIAILAAIAVPNFLEAQVRAKVSRAKADERSVATAIESYVVDNNRAPLSSDELKIYIPGPFFSDVNSFQELTTPIAYMTSIPHDPFTEKGNYGPGTNGAKLINANGTSMLQYKYYPWTVSGEIDNYVTCKNLGYIWSLGSRGPARSEIAPKNSTAGIATGGILADTAPDYLYDPSNGTVSFGWILRTNKGVTTGSEWPH